MTNDEGMVGKKGGRGSTFTFKSHSGKIDMIRKILQGINRSWGTELEFSSG
jgi:hypothetical protein